MSVAFGPFNRRTQLLTILGGAVIGAGSGYLYADSKALERINDLSATSRLRKEVQKLYVGLMRSEICRELIVLCGAVGRVAIWNASDKMHENRTTRGLQSKE